MARGYGLEITHEMARDGHYCLKCGKPDTIAPKEYPTAVWCTRCIIRMRVGNAIYNSQEARGVPVSMERLRKCYITTPLG